jgi:hypothetical protein
MTGDKPKARDELRHADLSARAPTDLSEAERAELNRRYEIFMRHFRASNLAKTPSSGMARRIRKWHP